MQFLAFQLYAPLASYGAPAVGEARPSESHIGRSALLGLIAAALGIRRDDDAAQDALREHYGAAVAVYADGFLLRDYHTAQVPNASDLKHRPHSTRADELAVPKRDLNTILSTRDYRQDSYSVTLLWQRSDAAPYPLSTLREALRAPQFTLYVGRKACPLAWPLQPQVVDAETLRDALAASRFDPPPELYLPARPLRVAWEGDVQSGFEAATIYSAPRKDETLSRRKWQFADRTEHIALLGKPSP